MQPDSSLIEPRFKESLDRYVNPLGMKENPE